MITVFSFTGCELGGEKCTVTTTLQEESTKNYHWEIHYSGSLGNGALGAKKGTSTQNPGATVVCGFFINCKFTSELATLSVSGGAPGTVTANKVPLLRSGGICPSEATWDAEYTVSAPSPLFVEGS